MSQEKVFRVRQTVKNALLSGVALLSFILVPLVWVPLIVGDWLLQQFKPKGPRRP